MGDVARVAVAEEHRGPRVLVRHVPAVQPRAVGGPEPGVLLVQAAGAPVSLGELAGDEDQLDPRGSWPEARRRDKRPERCARPATWHATTAVP